MICRLVVWLLLAPLGAAQAQEVAISPETNYLLGCGGCHGEGGVSNAKLVPVLRGQVGYFLNTEEGRRYLIQLPNVAFSTLDNRALADMLNYTVFTVGGASAPAGAKPFTADEVATWRRQPLNEVVLSKYRQTLINRLISDYGAPDSLRVYGSDIYDDN
jgi:hypothetical protein